MIEWDFKIKEKSILQTIIFMSSMYNDGNSLSSSNNIN